MLSRNLRFMLDRRGQPANLVKPNYGPYDPATGTKVTGNPASYTVKMYFSDYTLMESPSDSVAFGERRVLVSPVDTCGIPIPEPDEEDTISGVGDSVIVKSVQKIYNSNTLVCYICRVKE